MCVPNLVDDLGGHKASARMLPFQVQKSAYTSAPPSPPVQYPHLLRLMEKLCKNAGGNPNRSAGRSASRRKLPAADLSRWSLLTPPVQTRGPPVLNVALQRNCGVRPQRRGRGCTDVRLQFAKRRFASRRTAEGVHKPAYANAPALTKWKQANSGSDRPRSEADFRLRSFKRRNHRHDGGKTGHHQRLLDQRLGGK